MLTIWLLVAALGVVAIVWGAETFAQHLAVASTRLGVSMFVLAALLASAESEELATAVAASLRHAKRPAGNPPIAGTNHLPASPFVT